jgi:PAS domain S-box-containing protein
MREPSKTKQALENQLESLKQRIRELEQAESEPTGAFEALRESEERYRALVENASDLVYRMDCTGHVTFVNPSGLRITGYSEEELIGKNYSTLIRPDMRDDAIKFFGRQFVKRINNTYSEYPILTKEGGEVWLGQNTELVVKDGDVIGFQAVSRNITKRKQIEEELRRNHDVTERLAREMAIIAEIGRVVSSTLEIEEVYERFAAEVRKLIPFDRIALNLCNIPENIVTIAYVSGEGIPNRKKGDSPPLAGTLSELVLRERTGLIIQSETLTRLLAGCPRSPILFRRGCAR